MRQHRDGAVVRSKSIHQQGTSTTSSQEVVGASAAERLRQYVQEQATPLQGIICSYITRSGLAPGEDAWATAGDVFHETILEAFAHAERLDASIQVRAWLLGITVNILKRRKAALAKQRQEILASDLRSSANDLHPTAFFDQITSLTSPGPEEALEDQERVEEILALVSPRDQEVLRLGLLYDLDAQSLARALNITPGAARVRLHRALNRLRKAWGQAPGNEKRGEAHA